MSPELRTAIIKIVSNYFSWDKKRQEQYRVDTPEEDAFKIMQFRLKELFDLKIDAKGPASSECRRPVAHFYVGKGGEI